MNPGSRRRPPKVTQKSSREIAPEDFMSSEERARLAGKVRYVGSPYHKHRLEDYDFVPPEVKPRPRSTLCNRHRRFPLKEAIRLTRRGISLGLFSRRFEGEFPRYVWSVEEGEKPAKVYEARIGWSGYHGYPLDPTDPMHEQILDEWGQRCTKD